MISFLRITDVLCFTTLTTPHSAFFHVQHLFSFCLSLGLQLVVVFVVVTVIKKMLYLNSSFFSSATQIVIRFLICIFLSFTSSLSDLLKSSSWVFFSTLGKIHHPLYGSLGAQTGRCYYIYQCYSNIRITDLSLNSIWTSHFLPHAIHYHRYHSKTQLSPFHL